jgi:hypothetical protein
MHSYVFVGALCPSQIVVNSDVLADRPWYVVLNVDGIFSGWSASISMLGN